MQFGCCLGRDVTAIQQKICNISGESGEITKNRRWMRMKNLYRLVAFKINNFSAEFSGEITYIHCFEEKIVQFK